jgi:FAD/FMN-containing dehydrogenase
MQLLTPISGIVGRVLRRGEEGYEHYRQGTCWHARVPAQYPEYIVIATSDDDVVGAVHLARREGLAVAVRSGGHSWSGSHLRNGSVLIDMVNMRRVDFDPVALTATAQPGAKGSEVAEMLAGHQLYFPTGHNIGISLGGYLLQGGFPWAGREYGPSCMSVTGIDAVTMHGEFVHADENENADLLWAARGAGPGFFAVVTRFYLKLYPRHPVTMTTSFVFPRDCAPDVLRFMHATGTKTPTELTVAIARLDLAGGEPCVMLSATAFTDSEDEAREQLAIFDNLPFRDRALAVRKHRLASHTTLTKESQSVIDDNLRWIADNIFTHADFDAMWPTLERMLDTWPPAPSHFVAASWSGSPNEPQRPPMAFSIEDELYYAMYTAWEDAADDEKYIDWTTNHMKSWEPQTTGTMLADENLLHRPSRFVKDGHLARLDELRATWDPDGRFVAWLRRPDET